MQSVVLTVKRAFWAIFLCLAIISFPVPSLAMTVQDVPNPRLQYFRVWVTDMANLLDPETKVRLNQLISRLEHENGTEIAIVTVSDTAPSATPKEFATQLFKYWGIGKKGLNNGVLFLISKTDRRVEIETGKMVEAILPNASVGEIVNKEIIPRFKQDDFAGGILAGTQALVMALEGQHEVVRALEGHYDARLTACVIIGILIVAFVLGIGLTIDNPREGGSDSSSDSGGFGFGGSDSGSDSGGFGGGDSGGGGDGGSW
jgi:uncharacterized protein